MPQKIGDTVSLNWQARVLKAKSEFFEIGKERQISDSHLNHMVYFWLWLLDNGYLVVKERMGTRTCVNVVSLSLVMLYHYLNLKL